MHSSASLNRIGLAHIPANSVGVACSRNGIADAGTIGFLGVAVGRAHDLHLIMIAKHRIQLLLGALQLIDDLPVVTFNEAGVTIGVVADFAPGVDHILPHFPILLFQCFANHKEGNGHVVFFADIQHSLQVVDVIAIIHRYGNAFLLPIPMENNEALLHSGSRGNLA